MVYYWFVIFSTLCVSVANSNYTTAGYGARFVEDGVTEADSESPTESTTTLWENIDNGTNLSALLIDDDKVFPKQCGRQQTLHKGRIIGGKKASLGEYPWMARLIHKPPSGYKTFGCAGFLIHSKYVVTAAHCVHSIFNKIRGPIFSVVLGEHNSETKIDCSPGGTFCADPLQISRVAKILVHPEYDPNVSTHYNDIAVVYLNKGARFTDYVKPICLLKDFTQTPHKYTLSGWGKTESAPSSPIKLKVSIPPFDKTECKEKFSLLNIELRNSQICAGGEKDKDSCSGDSGGPLMMNVNSTWYAAGIVSYGVGCGLEDWPGVYTSVPSYFTWIKSQVIENSLIKNRGNGKKKHKNQKKAQET